jgi:flavodoxin
MKIKLLYYSGAGNTKLIASIIANKLSEKNYIVKSIRVAENTIALLDNDSDILILGFPVYFRDAPNLIYKVLEKLPGENRPIMVFTTKGLYSGNVFKNIHKVSVEKKFIPIGFLNILMPGTDLLTYAIKENSFKEKIALSIHSFNINKKIDKFISMIGNNKEIKKIHTKWYTLIDNLIVKKLEIKADNDHKDWIKKFTVNGNNCNKCMNCINGCPKENIRFMDGIIFGTECDVCLYCINNCPKNAISISQNSIGKTKYSEEKIKELFKI